MLEFYYDCLLEFVDRKKFECLECDTDSLYIAISGKSLQEVIKEELSLMDKRGNFIRKNIMQSFFK